MLLDPHHGFRKADGLLRVELAAPKKASKTAARRSARPPTRMSCETVWPAGPPHLPFGR